MGKAPGRSERKGISLLELMEMFPDEKAARRWFETIRWLDGERFCPRCGCMNSREVKNRKPMPYWCPDCRSYFSVRTGTTMQHSRLPLRKWVFALYLSTTNLKGISSMKLHRDLHITQSAAWYMQQRIRAGWSLGSEEFLSGAVEVDETYVGDKERNKHARKKTFARGPQGKTIVIGAKERGGKVVARPLGGEPGETLAGFVRETVEPGSTVYTDEHRAYARLRDAYNHRVVKHSAREYVRSTAHTNGMESFRATLKRGIDGVYHHVSVKHLHRYVNEFAGKHNVRSLDTLMQMAILAKGMEQKSMTYRDLTA